MLIYMLEIILMLIAIAVFGFCFYHQGKRDAHSQARLDILESIAVDFNKLGEAQISWNKTMRMQVEAMAMQECQRRMFTCDDVWFLYCEMQNIDATQHNPERIARGEGN